MPALIEQLQQQIDQLQLKGMYKSERVLDSPQSGRIRLRQGQEVINLCANNYLGLANHPEVVAAAHEALDRYGFGTASVRFICGTQNLHKTLEAEITQFLKTEDTILFPSCFDANGGVFEALLGDNDTVASDELNHASIIDGIRLCKANRLRYRHNDMSDLAEQLKQAKGNTLIVTDGVFSMDGTIANLKEICRLAQEHDAWVMIDDAHATGFLGDNGRGSAEYRGVLDQIDLFSGTLGKALGGAAGGYVSGNKTLIEWLRQRARPYLFSNSLAPMIVAGSLAALRLIQRDSSLRERLWENTRFMRDELNAIGLTLLPGEHPIIPIMLGDAKLARDMANRLLELGVYVIGFSFPVVPEGQARIRTQMSAAHTRADLEKAVAAFAQVAEEFGINNKNKQLGSGVRAQGL